MKLFMVILFYVAITAAYEDVNNIDFKKLLGDREAFHAYLGCLVDKNPCDELGNLVKAHVTESLADSCEECDETQKHVVHAFINLMKTEHPDLYEAFENKYDPDRVLLARLDEKAKQYWK